jgi:predicted TIM-barrel fold metal-dependent hydrolase
MEVYLDQEDVDMAVILPEVFPTTIGIFDIEEVAQFCNGSKRLIPFASINPNMSSKPGQELRTLVTEIGFRGLKLYPTYQHYYPNDNKVYPIYAVAEELQIPVMIHTGSSIFQGARMKYGDPLYLDDVAVDFPNLPIIQVHGGRGFWYQKAFFLMQLHENVYIEIAGLPPQNLLKYFPDIERNADKVIFGTDWPAVPGIRHNIEKIKQLPIGQEAKQKILGMNAAKILKL